MHTTFLEHVLKDLADKQLDVNNCTFVLPSKRSGTFLKKYIAQSLETSIFSPKVHSIQDFIAQISGVSQASNLELLLQLFEAYKKSALKQHDDFASFLKWGQTLLQDFNDIDGYLIPAKEILNYLSAIKELNHWSLQKDKTELIENYLELWSNLEGIYHSFTTEILHNKTGYQGLVQRKAVEEIKKGSQVHNGDTIVFVGFNALNAAESNIIQHYLELGNTHIYWDIDTYFLNDPIHDAGLFIRNYQRNWPYYNNRKIEGQEHFLQPKRISITGAPKNVAQSKYAGQLLQHIQNDSTVDLKQTALVLADEALLNPVLKSIPANIGEVNITMGLPLNKTVLYAFFQSYLELQLNKSDRGWFHKHVVAFLSNPYAATLLRSNQSNFAAELIEQINSHNWLFLNESMLSRLKDHQKAIQLVFPDDLASPTDWIHQCQTIIQQLKETYQQEKNAQELEYLYRFYTLFNQLCQFLENVAFVSELKSIKTLFKQLASMETLDFIGEPLSGLQIMGMLESRNLDFETVIITSVNEGILPSGKSNNSFIPFDVKRAYGLPTYKEKDAIYVYHFYRLIQRAKNVYIVYNTEPDVLEGGEKSRLVTQLLTDENLKPFVKHQIVSPEVRIEQPPLAQIPKNGQLLEDIKNFALNGFSPTSLTNYIKNPMDFYTRNILKINDLEEVEENIAANTFGTIVHDSLEALYTPFIGQVLTKEALSRTKTQISDVVKHQFLKQLPGIDIGKGKFLLVYNVIVKYLQNFLDKELLDIQRHQIKILGLETKYETILDLPDLPFPIKLKGTLDRVDEVDGVLRIIDYKTGKVEPKNVKISDWDELITNYDKAKAFQLLCYAYLYAKNHDFDSGVAGIYSFKNLSQGLFRFTEDKNALIDHQTLVKFEQQLHSLVKEICNVQIPLTEKVD
ncbi:MAG: PD-(D/E)XK nuclease family protein [Allomuricauda sp.]